MFDAAAAGIGPSLAGQLARVSLADVDDDGLIETLAAAEQLVRWATAAQLAVIRELVDRRGDPQFVEDEIATELKLSRVAAATRLGLAMDLARLPVVAAGMAEGRLDLPKAKAIAEAVAVLDPQVASDVAVEAVERAGRQTVGELRAWLRRAVLTADPAAAEARHARAVAERRVVLTPVGDGMAELWALLPADDAACAYAAVDACARATGGPTDSRTADQRRADALVDLLTGRTRTAPASTVQVTVPLSTLLGGDQPGELAGIGPIPAPMARRVAADGLWRWLATTDDGTLIDAGRRSYRPPAALADLIRGRDQTCRFPGCRQPARRCDLDHTVPYPAGPTNANNLASLCRHHHLLKHKAGWTVRQHPNGRLTWTSPAGRSYATSPPPHPPHSPHPHPPPHQPPPEKPTGDRNPSRAR
jgi:hypothetical protein